MEKLIREKAEKIEVIGLSNKGIILDFKHIRDRGMAFLCQQSTRHI
jgi:hypothetical protein